MQKSPVRESNFCTCLDSDIIYKSRPGYFWLLLVENMVTLKVYKKSSQNGQLYLYLGQRDFISSEGLIDDVNGVAYLPDLDQFDGRLPFLWLYNEIVYSNMQYKSTAMPLPSQVQEHVSTFIICHTFFTKAI